MRTKTKTLQIERKDVKPFHSGYRFKVGTKTFTVSDDEEQLINDVAASIFNQLKAQATKQICRIRGIDDTDDDAEHFRDRLGRLADAARTKATKSIGEITHPNDLEIELFDYAVNHGYQSFEVDLPDLRGRWIDDEEEGWTSV